MDHGAAVAFGISSELLNATDAKALEVTEMRWRFRYSDLPNFFSIPTSVSVMFSNWKFFPMFLLAQAFTFCPNYLHGQKEVREHCKIMKDLKEAAISEAK